MTDGSWTGPGDGRGHGAGSTGATVRDRTRRRFLRALFALGVVTGTTAALTPILRAGRSGDGHGARPVADEMYRGRHIRILAGDPAPGSLPDIRIDGRPLHVMRRADGSYLSAVNHYEPFPTPIEAARAAVDDLRGAQLAGAVPAHHI
ncbi:tyrosinase family oxidase copper chaperone [Streptomyces paludis]|uniref:Tyrosinase n=1 Tax=Streptomyces paludis TaxID=2282738 RepID=A0A345HZD7_9ACTN|nr:tyrosinase family oxidase copper chaperone [Streptomyces paludis]AXG82061.1 hypothetical protein DVK44_34865 [Streptomyces paludis]